VVFGDGPGGLFDTLDTLVGDLTTNAPGLATAVTAVDGVLDAVIAGLADVGARANRIEAMRRIASDQVVELRRQLSEVEDIDLPATVVDLQLQEVAYEAALGATARVLQPSLLDFLR
jgi:flagellar hook-associated protein 3 FlgL